MRVGGGKRERPRASKEKSETQLEPTSLSSSSFLSTPNIERRDPSSLASARTRMDIKRQRLDSKSQSDDEEDEEKTVHGGGGGTKLKGNTLRMKDLGEGEVEGGKLEGKWRKKW